MASRTIRPDQASGAPHRGSAAALRALPVPPDPLLGRDGDRASVLRMLADRAARLVTLTGPPGVGKTRLAMAAADEQARRAGWRAAFVDLAPVTGPMVASEFARSLGLDGADLRAVAAWLGTGPDTLVVLDNCEHVLAEVADIVRAIGSHPGLHLVATSRERLRVSIEHEFPVPPLAMPSASESVQPDLLRDNPSVALLLDRTRRHQPDFDVTADNAAAVVTVCRQLEGLPLALELAAARLTMHTPQELVTRLTDRMHLLAGRSRDGPARHRALHSAIDWSHHLLGGDEQRLFRRLAVFPSSFTVDDVAQICTDPDDDAEFLTESLVDKSLVHRASGDRRTARFAMLAGLRDYAADRLALAEETVATRDRHATRFAEQARQVERTLGLAGERNGWREIGVYQADLHAALQHSIDVHRTATALPLVAALGWFHYTRGDIGTGLVLLDRVAANPAARAAMQRDPAVRLITGILAWGAGDLARADDHLAEALRLAEAGGDLRRSTVARAFLGHLARAREEFTTAASWHAEAAAGFQALGNVEGLAWSRQDLGLLARDSGDLARAESLLRESLSSFTDLDYPWAAAWSAWGLASVLARRGGTGDAARLLDRALGTYRRLGDPRGIAQCLEALAEIAADGDHPDTALTLLGAASSQRELLSVPLGRLESERLTTVRGHLDALVGSEEADRLRHAGRTMPIDLAIVLAGEVCAAPEPRHHQPAALTARERQVAELIASGATNRRIARTLGIAEKTVEAHVHHIMDKLAAPSRAAVAAWTARRSTGTDRVPH